MHTDALDIGILGPAFIAGLLVLATHVPLGREVLRRGIIFIDLAVAQVAGLGVIAAHVASDEPNTFATQAAAMIAALAAAALLNVAEKRWPDIQEALIGVLFILAASAGLLLLADNPHGGEHLKDILVGQILWVSPHALITAAIIYGLVLSLWFGAAQRLGTWGFYVLFAITVTVSVQLVGVYLVFTSLIVPALATRMLTGRRALIAGYAIGLVGYICGIIASALWDLPTGAVVVWTLVLTALIAGIAIGKRTGKPKRRTARTTS